MNEAGAIGGVVRDLAAAGTWHEILVIDDGSTDATAAEAEAAGARVLRHPYNKGNGASVKTGIRAATGDYLLVIDGDGQHKPSDSIRLVSRLGAYALVVGARSSATQAGLRRRMGNAALNGLASSYLAQFPIPDLTSGFRAARLDALREFITLLPNGFSTPTTTTLCFLRAGYNVVFEPIEARTRVGQSKIRLARDGPKFLLIMLRVMTIFSPLRVFLPIAAASFLMGAGYAVWTIPDAIARHELLRPPDHARRGDRARGTRVRAGGGPARRWTPVARSRPFRSRSSPARFSPGSPSASHSGCLYWTGQVLTRDELEYLSLARSLAAGHGFVYDDVMRASPFTPFGRSPGYPAFLALIGAGRRVFASAPAAVKVAQSFIGAAGVWLAAIVAFRVGGSRGTGQRRHRGRLSAARVGRGLRVE